MWLDLIVAARTLEPREGLPLHIPHVPWQQMCQNIIRFSVEDLVPLRPLLRNRLLQLDVACMFRHKLMRDTRSDCHHVHQCVARLPSTNIRYRLQSLCRGRKIHLRRLTWGLKACLIEPLPASHAESLHHGDRIVKLFANAMYVNALCKNNQFHSILQKCRTLTHSTGLVDQFFNSSHLNHETFSLSGNPWVPLSSKSWI